MGTLVRLEPPGPRLRAQLRERCGVDVGEERAAAAFRAEIDHYVAHHLAGGDPAGLERLRDDCAAAVAAALRFEPHPDAAPAIGEVRGRGLSVVAVSNWDRSLPQVLEAVGLARLLDGVVASAEVGAAKPDPAIFRAALEMAGAPPERALHVGDSVEHDVEGAQAAGVRAVLLVRDRGAEPPPAVTSIRSLRELASVT